MPDSYEPKKVKDLVAFLLTLDPELPVVSWNSEYSEIENTVVRVREEWCFEDQRKKLYCVLE